MWYVWYVWYGPNRRGRKDSWEHFLEEGKLGGSLIDRWVLLGDKCGEAGSVSRQGGQHVLSYKYVKESGHFGEVLTGEQG